MRHLPLLIALSILPALVGCGNHGRDLEVERRELLQLHKNDRKAHVELDMKLLQERSPTEFIYVTDGKIQRIRKAENEAQFAEYFKGAKYHEWDDLEEPIVRISKDGSMAWMVTRVKVKRTQKDPAGKETETKFVYAGIMTYEKVDDRWMRVANASTFEPLK